VLADVLDLIEDLRAEAETERQPIDAIGLGVCELVSPSGQVLSDNCVAWRGVPVQERLCAVAPAVVEADVRAAALAEALFGAGRSRRCFLYVTVGTGISASLVVDGKPFLGARGATGTVASSAWVWACARCGHANGLSLEQIASGPALVARYQQCGGVASNAEAVLEAAAHGEPAAVAVVRSAGAALGQTIAWLVNALDPEVVILGGGLGLSAGEYWESLVGATRRHIWSDVHRQLPIVGAQTGADAGVLGAAAAAWQQHRAERR
jgi:glucokinase